MGYNVKITEGYNESNSSNNSLPDSFSSISSIS